MPKHGNTQIKSWAYSAAPLVKKTGKKIKKSLYSACSSAALLMLFSLSTLQLGGEMRRRGPHATYDDTQMTALPSSCCKEFLHNACCPTDAVCSLPFFSWLVKRGGVGLFRATYDDTQMTALVETLKHLTVDYDSDGTITDAALGR